MLYAIGDIHGEFDLLFDLYEKIMNHSKQYDEPHTIVCLGDYVDRGPESKGVIDFLMTNPFDDFNHIYLKGNHEDMMVKSLFGQADSVMYEHYHYNMYTARGIFLDNGGEETLKSFGINDPELLMNDVDSIKDIFTPYVGFFGSLKNYYDTDKYIFVHGGIEPGIDLDKQNPNIMFWIRGKFLSSDFDHGRLVIHGHTPTTYYNDGKIDRQFNRINIDTHAYSTGILTAACLNETDISEPMFLSTKRDDAFTVPITK